MSSDYVIQKAQVADGGLRNVESDVWVRPESVEAVYENAQGMTVIVLTNGHTVSLGGGTADEVVEILFREDD